jgi:hypothetical protein
MDTVPAPVLAFRLLRRQRMGRDGLVAANAASAGRQGFCTPAACSGHAQTPRELRMVSQAMADHSPEQRPRRNCMTRSFNGNRRAAAG